MDTTQTNFSDLALASLSTAIDEATLRRAAEVDPEHILLGVIRSAAAAGLLGGVPGGPSALQSSTEAALTDTPRINMGEKPVLSFRTERVLREATDEARRAGHNEVDTTHLVLGLLNEGGAAALILRQRGFDAQTLRHRMRQQDDPVQPVAKVDLLKVVPRQPAARGRSSLGPLWRVLPRLIDWRAVLVLGGAVAAGIWMSTQPRLEIPGVFCIVIGGWLISLCAHEFAHAFVADLGGDQSVRDHGYLSFNPLAYTNMLFSIVLPVLFLFMGGIGLPGGAVYIDRSRLRGALWESMVSAAGPFASFLMALFWALPFWIPVLRDSFLGDAHALWAALALLVSLNLWGVLFNLLPVPPLDGFGMLAPFLPAQTRYQLYSMGMMWLWLLYLAMIYSPALGSAFWGTIQRWLLQLGVSPMLAGLGLELFMFWR